MVKKLHKVTLTPSEQRNHYNNQDQEIDLLDLAARLISILRRNSAVLASSLLFGVFAGMSAYFFLGPLYKSELVISVPAVKSHEFKRILLSFREKVNHRQQPGVEPEELKAIEQIELPLAENQSFIIEATVTDQKTLKSLQAAFLDYLSNNAFIKENLQIERSKKEQAVLLINSENRKITDALDRILLSDNLSDARFSVADLAKLKLEMQKEKIALESELNNLDAVFVVQDFTIPAWPSNKNIFKILAVSVFGCLMIGIGITSVIETSRMMKRTHSKNRFLR